MTRTTKLTLGRNITTTGHRHQRMGFSYTEDTGAINVIGRSSRFIRKRADRDREADTNNKPFSLLIIIKLLYALMPSHRLTD